MLWLRHQPPCRPGRQPPLCQRRWPRAPRTTGGSGPSPSSGGGGSDGGGGGGGGSADQLNLNDVVWLHHDVRNWPKTSTITGVSLLNPPICVGHTKAGRWPAVRHSSGILVEGNPWVFAKINGWWYGVTWEWLRPGQTCKQRTGHDFRIHVASASPLSGWTPRSGEKVGFMVSTPARFGPMGPARERSNVVIVTCAVARARRLPQKKSRMPPPTCRPPRSTADIGSVSDRSTVAPT